MKRFALVLLALATALAITPKASADSITGTLQVSGTNNSTNSSISITGATVANTSTGDFTGIIGQGLTINPFTGVPEAMISGGPDGLAFDLQGYTIAVCPVAMPGCSDVVAGFWDITGYGLMSLTGYDNTMYSFSFSTQVGAGDTFSATAMTPEPSSLLLLGTGLLGLAIVVFRKAKSSPRLMVSM
jgi:hypothetical protein